MNKKTVKDIDLKGKRVFMRVDFNVPLDESGKHVTDDTRIRETLPSIEFALKQEPIVDVILKAMAKGKMPERVTHNDTKFNNVMLDVLTGEAMCFTVCVRRVRSAVSRLPRETAERTRLTRS